MLISRRLQMQETFNKTFFKHFTDTIDKDIPTAFKGKQGDSLSFEEANTSAEGMNLKGSKGERGV